MHALRRKTPRGRCDGLLQRSPVTPTRSVHIIKPNRPRRQARVSSLFRTTLPSAGSYKKRKRALARRHRPRENALCVWIVCAPLSNDLSPATPCGPLTRKQILLHACRFAKTKQVNMQLAQRQIAWVCFLFFIRPYGFQSSFQGLCTVLVFKEVFAMRSSQNVFCIRSLSRFDIYD